MTNGKHPIGWKSTGAQQGDDVRVSVIIPTYNEQSNITAAIESALAADADEVIVVDGGSTDETLRAAGRAGVTLLQSDQGRANQQNAGALKASGEVLLFLHADCRLHIDSVKQILTAMSEDSSCVGGCFRQAIDDPRWRYRVVEFGNSLRVRILKWIYGDQALFVRASVFEELSGFPPIPFLEDLQFSRRLGKRRRLIVLPAKLVVSARRWQKTGLVRQTVRNWLIVTAAVAGSSPARLAKFYPKVR